MAEAGTIRRMTRGDIPFGMVLKDFAGWNQLPLDWERFLEFEPEGCFIAELERQPAGTATTIAYEKLFGWVGMVLVHPDMRRRGIGTALLMAGIEYLEEKGVAAVKLDATPMGKQLYDTLGFVDEYVVERWQGTGQETGSPSNLTLLSRDHLEVVSAFDTPILGADRGRVLSRLLTEATVRVAGRFDAVGNLLGYAAVRPGQKAAYVGPWVASDPETAAALWDWALAVVSGLPVFVDIPLPNPHVLQLLRGYGFEKQRPFIRMYRGENLSPGRPELQYGIFGVEVG